MHCQVHSIHTAAAKAAKDLAKEGWLDVLALLCCLKFGQSMHSLPPLQQVLERLGAGAYEVDMPAPVKVIEKKRDSLLWIQSCRNS